MMNAYIQRRRAQRWDTFLKTEWLVISGAKTYETVPTHVWAYDLTHSHIIPLLQSSGYVLSCNTAEFVNCLLNSMYRHIQDSHAMEPTLYMCKHACACSKEITADVEEHFHGRKFPPNVWEAMRKRVGIEQWSDESDLAVRFWTDLPHLVLAHTDLVASNMAGEMEEFLNAEDDEEGSATSKKKDIDPYLLDYYGAKYKKYDD
jgi:hypothetical protein